MLHLNLFTYRELILNSLRRVFRGVEARLFCKRVFFQADVPVGCAELTLPSDTRHQLLPPTTFPAAPRFAHLLDGRMIQARGCQAVIDGTSFVYPGHLAVPRLDVRIR